MGHWTLDNAENNKTFLQELEKLVKARNLPISFDASDRRIRCFAHIINLVVQHVLAVISQSKPFATTEDEDEDEDGLVSQTRDLSIEQTFKEAAARDPVGLARKLVRALRASNSRRVAFQESLKIGKEKGYFDMKPLQLLRDVATRWDSTYQMIKRLIYLRSVSTALSLLLLTDSTYQGIEDFLRQDANKHLRRYSLTPKEWEVLGHVGLILEVRTSF
jgi:hypothetical protein